MILRYANVIRTHNSNNDNEPFIGVLQRQGQNNEAYKCFESHQARQKLFNTNMPERNSRNCEVLQRANVCHGCPWRARIMLFVFSGIASVFLLLCIFLGLPNASIIYCCIALIQFLCQVQGRRLIPRISESR